MEPDGYKPLKVVKSKKALSKYAEFEKKLIVKYGKDEKVWPVDEIFALSKQPK